ncbi:hypothetical protein PVAG01_05700 [Phlyctema vagabunda]|uniref:Uncharacterized protein n=1 Tax=Phlyctema vagabunda TaxID=108571 RepID=A0ABR4PL39_9HELO
MTVIRPVTLVNAVSHELLSGEAVLSDTALADLMIQSFNHMYPSDHFHPGQEPLPRLARLRENVEGWQMNSRADCNGFGTCIATQSLVARTPRFNVALGTAVPRRRLRFKSFAALDRHATLEHNVHLTRAESDNGAAETMIWWCPICFKFINQLREDIDNHCALSYEHHQ